MNDLKKVPFNYTYFLPSNKEFDKIQQQCKTVNTANDISSLKDVFHHAKHLYNPKNDPSKMDYEEEPYKISKGMIITVSKPPLNLFFSYYILGNKDDEYEILNARSKGQLLCFNCDLCSLNKPNSVGLVQYSSINIIQNLVDELCHDVTEETGVGFRLTSNASSYLPSHLLLSTKSHIPNFCTFITPNVFTAYFLLMKRFYENEINANCLWNGKGGSNMYHSHCHLTDYNIPVISYCKDIYYNEFLGDMIEKFKFEGRGYILLKTTDISLLQSSCSNFIKNSQIFPMKKYDDLQSLVVNANMFVYESTNKIIYYSVIFSLINNDQRSFEIDGERISYIPSSSQLMISEKQSDYVNKNIDNILLYINTNLYYSIDIISENDFLYLYRNSDISPYTDIIVSADEIYNGKKETYELLGNVNFNINNDLDKLYLSSELIYVYLSDNSSYNIINDVYCTNFIKILKYYSCFTEECDEYEFGFFKQLLTLVFINYASIDTNNDDININDNNVKNFLFNLSVDSNKFSYKRAISSIGDIYTDTCTWMKGSFFNEVLIKSIGNSIMYTPIENINNLLRVQQGKIGDVSAYSYNMKANINFINNFNLLIKIQQLSTEDDTIKMFNHEVEVGKIVNKLRTNCYNYMLTFGRMVCEGEAPVSPNTSFKLCNERTDSLAGYIFVEYIYPSVTFSSGLMNNNFTGLDICSLVCQTLICMIYSNMYYEFTHYDLHLGNILAVPISNCVNTNMSVTTYHLSSTIIEILCFSYYPVIIDYGRTYIKGMDVSKIYVNKDLALYSGVTSNKPNKIFDNWTFFINFIIKIASYNPMLVLISPSNYTENLNSNFISSYIKLFFKYCYQFIMIDNEDYINKYTYVDNVDVIYSEFLNICNECMMTVPYENKENFVKYKFQTVLFVNIYTKLQMMSIWNIPEKYSNKIDANGLLDDIENLIKDYQTNIKNLYIQYNTLPHFEIKNGKYDNPTQKLFN